MKTSNARTSVLRLSGALVVTVAMLLVSIVLFCSQRSQAQPPIPGDSRAFLPLVIASRASATPGPGDTPTTQPTPVATSTKPPIPTSATGVPPLTATPGCGSSLPAPAPISPGGAIYPAGRRTIAWSSVPTASHYNLLVEDKSDSTHNINVTVSATTYDYEFRTGHVYSLDVYAVSTQCHMVGPAAHADISVLAATPTPTLDATASPTPQPGPHTVSLPCRAWLLSSAGPSYEQALNGANISIMAPNNIYGQPNTVGAGQSESTDYYIEKSYLFCDTSSIPGDATVQWATLHITNCGGHASVPFTVQWYESDAGEPITAANWPGLFQPGVVGSMAGDQCPSGGSATVVLTPSSVARAATTTYFVTTDRVQDRSGVSPNTAEFLRFDVANSDALTVHFEVP